MNRFGISPRCWIAVGILFVILIVTWVAYPFFASSIRHGKGVSDFIGYWAAFQLYHSGQNPYDFSLQAAVEKAIGFCCIQNETYSVWNAPWTFIIFYPFLMWPFAVSASLWFAMNLLIPFVIAWLIKDAWYPSIKIRPALLHLSAICVVPYLYLMMVGQTSLWVVLGWAGAIWAMEKKRDFAAGCFLTLTTIKPHLGYLIYPLILIWMIRNKRYFILVGGLVSLGLVTGLAEILHPGVYLQRLQMHATPFALAAATLETQIRILLLRYTGHNYIWPAVVISSLTMILVICYYWRRPIVWKQCLPPLFCISLITMPYGGINDFNLLAISQIAWIGAMDSGVRRRFGMSKRLGVLALFHLFTLGYFLIGMKELQDLWWYSLTLLTILIIK